MLDDAFRRRGAAAVVGGTMASGKTVLLDSFSRHAAEQGAVVLTATASAEEESLPFGVVGQLLRNLPEPLSAPTEEWLRALEQDWDRLGSPGAAEQDTVDAAQAFGAELFAGAPGPVVLAVDDAQFLDGASLHCLLAAARRIGRSGLLIVATTCGCPHWRCRRFRSRMGRLSGARQLRLGPLTEAEVAMALRDRFGGRVGSELAAECHAATGGNLALLDALCRDIADAAEAGGRPRVEPGAGFREAVLECVERCPPDRLAVLQLTALMGDSASEAQIAALAGLDRGVAASDIRMLHEAGLLAGGLCRHPAIAAAVAEGMPVEQRRAAHERFARLLHEENAPAAMAARQLIAAGLPPLPWAVQVFRLAAEEQSCYDVEAAAQCLRAARQLTGDEDERAALTVTLAALAWRASPVLVRRRLPELLDLVRAGRLDCADSEQVLRFLLWFGQEDDAADALRALLAAATARSADGVAQVRRTMLGLSIWHPALLRRVLAEHDLRFEDAARGEAVRDRIVDAGNLYRLMLGNAGRREIAVEAQRLVESCRLADGTLDDLCTALLALLGANEMEYASRTCESLLKEAESRGGRTWRAQLTALRAEIAFRRGDLRAAAGHAESALMLVPAEDWGVRIGMPLATLIRAATALGEHDRAAEALEEPVPAAMLETGVGMLYLNARGRYLMAVGRPERARAEFQACWDYSRRRGVELPNLLPWRGDLAEAHARLGDPDRARALAQEQLALARGGSAEGVALRVLGATADPGPGRALLERSAAKLHACGARLEAALSLIELARCHQALGDERRALSVQRRAQALGAACGIPPDAIGLAGASGIRAWPASGLGPARDASDASDAPDEPDPAAADRGTEVEAAVPRPPAPAGSGRRDVGRLSKAEQRVAALAVRGLSNVQIARRLFLTVSTVEQHLTHTYKKLSIRGRAELPTVAGIAAAFDAAFDVMPSPAGQQ